jgi:hypothetical protein
MRPRNFNFGVGDVGWCIHLLHALFFLPEDLWILFARQTRTDSDIQELLASCSLYRVLKQLLLFTKGKSFQQGDPSCCGLGLITYHGSWAIGTDQT